MEGFLEGSKHSEAGPALANLRSYSSEAFMGLLVKTVIPFRVPNLIRFPAAAIVAAAVVAVVAVAIVVGGVVLTAVVAAVVVAAAAAVVIVVVHTFYTIACSHMHS